MRSSVERDQLVNINTKLSNFPNPVIIIYLLNYYNDKVWVDFKQRYAIKVPSDQKLLERKNWVELVHFTLWRGGGVTFSLISMLIINQIS